MALQQLMALCLSPGGHFGSVNHNGCLILTLYSDRFSHTDKSNQDGIVHYIFKGSIGRHFPIMVYLVFLP